MIKMTVVVPNPELYDKAREILLRLDNPNVSCAMTHIYGTRVDDKDLGQADIILARGLTHQALKRKYRDATVLELAVSVYDVIRAVHECKKRFGAKRIAVVSSYSVSYDAKALSEIVGAELKVFFIHNEADIQAVLDEARRDGFDAVVGGLTAFAMAERQGWNCERVTTSVETLNASIQEAVNTAMVMHNERAKAEISRSILQNAKEAVLFFDMNGRLSLYNRRVFETLNIPPDEPIAGRGVDELFTDAQIVEIVQTHRESHNLIKTINRSMLISDYVPVKVGGEAIGVICSFQRVNEIQATETRIRKELSNKGLVAKYGFDNIIHASPALAKTIATAHKYADVDANVLLIGETGTGKELFAQSIHNASQRRLEPFVAVNCAAFPENLLESELFGYAEGAFSGAAKGGKTGLFELAHGGTMFLDEIGEIPFSLQATLLRALQESEIRKIGDDKVIPVNVRIIAATNMDLREKVASGGFRMDLLYRLDVLSLSIPPLRERREDIGHIADYYIQSYCLKYNKIGMRLTPEALAALEEYHWPGNTRELRNVCERLVVLGEGNRRITRETVMSLLAVSIAMPPKEESEERQMQDAGMKPANIDQLVQFANSMRMNRADIANMLGISRTTLWRRMNKQNKLENET